ncbi:MAG: GNAT family N-acetyltransferase [Clostridia bacterium]|nr:GNAT family N-acetyltransferase [Clostridia bacterium]
MAYEIIALRCHEELIERAADWFYQKWGIPKEAYVKSMSQSPRDGSAPPQWYIAVDGAAIVAGIGVVENDFHARSDLRPNACALYVEQTHRGMGIAGALLEHVCAECAAMGEDALYLVTDHTAFYERYGWTFLCTVAHVNGVETGRMYVHDTRHAAPRTAVGRGISETREEHGT